MFYTWNSWHCIWKMAWSWPLLFIMYCTVVLNAWIGVITSGNIWRLYDVAIKVYCEDLHSFLIQSYERLVTICQTNPISQDYCKENWKKWWFILEGRVIFKSVLIPIIIAIVVIVCALGSVLTPGDYLTRYLEVVWFAIVFFLVWERVTCPRLSSSFLCAQQD